MLSQTCRVAVLVSGGGTNLQAILDAQAAGSISHGEVALVVSNNRHAYALERAAKAGIPAKVLLRQELGGQAGFEAALEQALREARIDLIVLAGFLTILSPDFARRWDRRILNVHPALIPAFCGKGYYGLRVHEEAPGREGHRRHGPFCQRDPRRGRDPAAEGGGGPPRGHPRNPPAPGHGAGGMDPAAESNRNSIR